MLRRVVSGFRQTLLALQRSHRADQCGNAMNLTIWSAVAFASN
jgi:hypothetical protein